MPQIDIHAYSVFSTTVNCYRVKVIREVPFVQDRYTEENKDLMNVVHQIVCDSYKVGGNEIDAKYIIQKIINLPGVFEVQVLDYTGNGTQVRISKGEERLVIDDA